MSAPEASTSAPPAPTVMFKKGPRSRPNQSRRREATPPADDASPAATDSDSAVVRPTKKSILNPLVQGTKRRRAPGEEVGGLDEFDFKADGGGITQDEYATRSADWDLEGVEKKEDKRIKLNEDGEIVRDDGLYHGQSGYLSTINKRADQSLAKSMRTGPIRATANIRTITVVDYQPDVCKPYKETGFCGYGDSCKFMHDRGDYLAGWQLDKLDPDEVKEIEEEEEEMLPFACLICKREFTEPIVTKCGHYFCLDCAMKRFTKSPKCYACGAATQGLFNKAEKLLAKLAAKRKRRMEEKGIVEEEGDGGIEIGGEAGSDEEGGAGGDDDSGPEGGRWESAPDSDDE
ncbi:RNA-splicing factor [Vanrija albida]|uniref:Pre-mRNA-splicing factor CWC24 n=1 Tax=Vanrija albida TaxID=181172 RepID=A0ABR3Q6I6_9TREE